MNTALESNASLLAVLDDDLLRRTFLFVRAKGLPVSREQVAEEVGISRKLAAFHLDKLTEKGLLNHHYARPPGRGGPGAGRPAKVYEPSSLTIEISVPQRQYELAGGLLLDGVANPDEGTTARQSVQAVLEPEPGHCCVKLCSPGPG
ncbi:MAG TPA: hypothetical protein VHI31_07770 [Actinomycetota bacterium]|nr:hypothetical protein [Actinomycetota bacterium]